jgi:hypothetical protein
LAPALFHAAQIALIVQHSAGDDELLGREDLMNNAATGPRGA